jgi:hypothetical protein
LPFKLTVKVALLFPSPSYVTSPTDVTGPRPTILYPELDDYRSDIVLVENFH